MDDDDDFEIDEIARAILLLIAVAGSGKTREVACYLASLAVAHAVVAAPTIAMIRETEDWLKRFNCTVPVVAIHSDQGGSRAVMERVRKWWEEQEKKSDPRGGILVCSHAAFLDMVPPKLAGEFDLYIDEPPQVFSFATRWWQGGHHAITRFLAADPYTDGVLRLRAGDTPNAYDQLVYKARNRPFNEFDALVQQVAAEVIDPHRWVLVLADQWDDLVSRYSAHVYGGQLDILAIVHPDQLAPWQSATIMGARAQKTMLHLIWSKLFRQDFGTHPLQATLPARHTNGHRLTIRYFFQDRATRSMLSKRAAGGGTMQTAMCRAVAQHYGDRPFLWTLPQPKEGGGVKSDFWNGPAFDPKLRLPGRSFGLNKWRDHRNLALLSVINFSPDQHRLLELLGLDPAAIFDAFAVTVMYQDLCRGNLRVPDGTKPVELVVPDLPGASLLAAELPGCNLLQMPQDAIPTLAEPLKRGPKPTGRTPDAERKRKSRAIQRAAADFAAHARKEDVE